MHATIDMAGRVVIPKAIREELGFTPGTELELRVVNGRLEISIPSRVRVEEGPHGIRLVADEAEELTDEQVRDLIERTRR
jgi:AbrB family looped-hinge helix DNA binding protein